MFSWISYCGRTGLRSRGHTGGARGGGAHLQERLPDEGELGPLAVPGAELGGARLGLGQEALGDVGEQIEVAQRGDEEHAVQLLVLLLPVLEESPCEAHAQPERALDVKLVPLHVVRAPPNHRRQAEGLLCDDAAVPRAGAPLCRCAHLPLRDGDQALLALAVPLGHEVGRGHREVRVALRLHGGQHAVEEVEGLLDVLGDAGTDAAGHERPAVPVTRLREEGRVALRDDLEALVHGVHGAHRVGGGVEQPIRVHEGAELHVDALPRALVAQLLGDRLEVPSHPRRGRGAAFVPGLRQEVDQRGVAVAAAAVVVPCPLRGRPAPVWGWGCRILRPRLRRRALLCWLVCGGWLRRARIQGSRCATLQPRLRRQSLLQITPLGGGLVTLIGV